MTEERSPAVSRPAFGKFVFLMGMGLLAVTALLAYLIWSGYREEIQAAETLSRNYATIIEARLEATLRRADAQLQELTQDLPVAAMSKRELPRYADEIDAHLDMHRRNFQELSALRIFDADGDMLYTTDRATTPPLNVSDRGIWKELRDDPRDRAAFSEVMVGRVSGRESLFVARAIRDDAGAFLGIVGAVIELDRFVQLFQSVDVGTRGLIAVFRSDLFALVSHWPIGSLEINATLPPTSQVRRIFMSGAKAGTYRGNSRISSFRAVESYPFLVLVGLARDEVLAEWRTRSLTIAFAGLSLLLFLASLLRHLWRSETGHGKVLADLYKAQQYFRELFEFAPDAILLVGSDGSILLANRQAEGIFGYSRDELVGRPVEILMPSSARSKHVGLRHHFMAAGTPRTMGLGLSTLEGLKKDGTPFPVDISIAPFGPAKGKMVAAIVRDITVRKAIERDLAATQDLLSDSMESIEHAIALYDREGRLVLFNRNYANHSPGMTDLIKIGVHVEDLIRASIERGLLVVPPGREAADVVAERMAAHNNCDGSVVVQHLADGRIFHVTSRRTRNGHVIVIRSDVTDQVRAEARLLEGQRLEAIGKLTGGMAHDFNNYLGVIIGNLDLLLNRTAADPVATEWIEAALRGAESSAQLTRSLLAFARKQPLAPRRIDVGHSLEGVATLLKRTLGEDIVLKVTVATDVWPVRIDGSQFDSAIINLANNARDAMPQGGHLTISARNVHIDDLGARRAWEVASGDYVLVEVSDAGSGMPPEAVARAFEPFFSTKPVGHGTGLGLSMVYGFVKQSGGWVYIDSEVGRGTTVRLYLPRDRDVQTAAVDASEPKLQVAGGNESILLVEDNPVMRETTVQQLTSLGYRTIEAENGEVALAVLKQRDRRIDLLFTDVVMPGRMNGYELVEIARRTRPGIKTLVTSGFSGVRVEGVDLLVKPYRLADLARAIRGALDASAPGNGRPAADRSGMDRPRPNMDI